MHDEHMGPHGGSTEEEETVDDRVQFTRADMLKAFRHGGEFEPQDTGDKEPDSNREDKDLSFSEWMYRYFEALPDPLIRMANIQTCPACSGQYIANSHEYPCPYCTNPDEINEIRAILEKLLSIETLEYHNKNYLAGDDKKRCEAKRSLILEGISITGVSAKDRVG